MATIRTAGNRHRLAALALLTICVLGVYWLIDGVIIAKYRYYRANVEQLQDRLQRYKGMLATRAALEAQIRQIRQDSSTTAYYLDEPSATLAATDLQQQVKGAVESGGGSLVSTQILPVTDEGAFSRIAIRVQMTGDTDALQKMLYTLESARPLLLVNDLAINARTIRAFRNNNRNEGYAQLQLTAQFELAGYMRRGKG